MKKRDLFWKLRWRLRWWWSETGLRERERNRHFYLMTGLHPCYVFGGKRMSDEEVIAVQARKIKGLDMQLDQQRRGYQRKVARLEKKLAEADAARATSDGQATPGMSPLPTLKDKQ